MSKTLSSESNDHNTDRKTSRKRSRDDEENENQTETVEVPPAESLTTSTPPPTAPQASASLIHPSTPPPPPPSWITRLRKPELKAELNDRLVPFSKKDKKTELINLLVLDTSLEPMRARIPALNADVISYIVSYLDYHYSVKYRHPSSDSDSEDDDEECCSKCNNKLHFIDFSTLHNAAQISKGFWHHAKRLRQLVIEQDGRNKLLKTKVIDWCEDRVAAKEKYGHICNFDVSGVTSMVTLFEDQVDFNEDLSRWNVSNVTTMASMFNGAESFNGDLSRWDVSRVRNMRGMFYNAKSFNQDLPWNVSNVLFMGGMFSHADSFNQYLAWNVQKCTEMESMFHATKAFKGDGLSSWDTGNVTDMEVRRSEELSDEPGNALISVRYSMERHSASLDIESQ
ncbi:hypothetical protein TrLO_g16011 [Triparma laevis f. longispina]|uniref:BspA family leucine-rich repeat surface protein n=1 Tax=Triparma laevis f. longispina TaxID=1714387 RepID=A0A9W7E5T6_9STRA|nr:hypothetical protein TrLO_g16011 [Triparma laevis f. longispina]